MNKDAFVKQESWKLKYIDRFVERGLTVNDGKTAYEANKDDHDFDEDPIDAADEELSYWAD